MVLLPFAVCCGGAWLNLGKVAGETDEVAFLYSDRGSCYGWYDYDPYHHSFRGFTGLCWFWWWGISAL
jgi:hypothetical protein